MAEQNIHKQKPQEILELEKIYKTTFNAATKLKILLDNFGNDPMYFLDENGEITAIYITDLPNINLSPIGNLKNLNVIILGRNEIQDISLLFPMPNLKYLYLGGNKISDIAPILQSINLQELALWGNPIKNISLIGLLLKLEGLYCQQIGITDISFVCNLRKLKELYLDGNSITDIAPIETLSKLKTIRLTNNQIKEIPKRIAERFDWLNDALALEYQTRKNDGIFLANNPLSFPPTSVIELGPGTVKNYYETAEQFGHAPLSEGRILFVGDGSAGKTSLIERILYNTFDENRKQTNGIKIEHLKLQHPDDRRDLTFHIWDFGGQEIQHAVHKFFFTEGCLYVLVLDNRKEEEPEYWLQQIESLGGKAPVMVVFNKQDQNIAETVDRKYLKEKYPNIVGFYNISCSSGFGIADFTREMEHNATHLLTVDEQFPNNWFAIKQAIQQCTSGNQHYLNFDSYREICLKNQVTQLDAQKLLLKYFTTIGAVTWFGDTYLNFMHVLNPAWITQGVYKIITSKKTARLFGQVQIADFKEMLQPTTENDYTYEEKHYGYILSMMKKFDLCYTPDDKILLIPSAFGKEPRMEYRDFRGENVRVYILQFRDYMPLALIHKYIAIKLPEAYANNYWYTGIVTQDCKTDSLAMVHADKEAKRIYIRIKGEAPLGMWEHIRRVFHEITSAYASINYQELAALDEKAESVVDYEDLVSHIQAGKGLYFHPRLKRDFNVGYLMGLFESKEESLQKFETGKLSLEDEDWVQQKKQPMNFVVQILNNNSQTVTTSNNIQIHIDIDIQQVTNLSSELKGEAQFLLEELQEEKVELREALAKLIQFAEDARTAPNSAAIKEKAWGRRLKKTLQTLKDAGETLKTIEDGTTIARNILNKTADLAQQFNLHDTMEWIKALIN